MSKISTVAAFFLALIAGSCSSDKIVGRYKTAVCQVGQGGPSDCHSQIPTASATAVSVASTPTASNPAPAPTPATPPDRALAACIQALNNTKVTSATQTFCNGLSGKPASKPTPAPTGIADRTLFHRTIIISVRKDGPFNPADRLEGTDIEIHTPSARFDTWDTLATTYTVINAGTVQLTQARGFTEGITPGLPSGLPLTGGASFTGSQTNTRVENYNANVQAETLTAAIDCDGHCLRIHRQGGNGVDLTGNTVIKVDMSFCETQTTDGPCLASRDAWIFSVDKYQDVSGKLLDASKISLAWKKIATPPPSFGTDGIRANVGLTYTLRHVTVGDATYEEGDDSIEEITPASVTTPITLISGREVAPPIFGLFQTVGPLKGFAVKVQRPDNDPVGACFDTYEEAWDFLSYLRAINMASKPIVIAKSKLEYVDPSADNPIALTGNDAMTLIAAPGCF